ncbi:MAG: hypothetical protein CBC59_007570 [Euryarchaeota archaeon TMED99]|nr:MAG: hypothetical protein CBC59_007570 [Euryarchaeota archaeon TMED99]
MVALPLFVLPMVLMPGEIQELRVFEPRYRQMLDDCLLDERNFGLVMNDPFQPVNGWDGPRQHGCEVEILHHETKGSNHFLQIIGRRRFTILDIAKPALPPFSDPMFEPHVGEEGLLPDLQTLFELIPEDVESTKLYISAEVEFHAQEEETTEDQQEVLKEILDHVLHRIGKVLRIEEDILMQWVKERVDYSISEDPNSVYTVSALVVNELESKQQILACNTLEEALEELLHHVEMIQEEE